MEEVAATHLYENNPALFWTLLVTIGLFLIICRFLINLGKKVDSIQGDVTTLKEHFGPKDDELFKKLSMKKSPRILNKNGESIYKIINGEAFLSENKNLLLSKIAGKNPITMLDVEMDARDVCIELQSNPIFNNIKNIVYDHPEITIKDENGQDVQHSITMADVHFVLSIPLRDMYLAIHKDSFPDIEESELSESTE